MSEHCVIIGAGHAASQLCTHLVRLKWQGKISLIGDESYLPYHRPPLSKAQLQADAAEPQLIKPANFYADNNIEILSGKLVTAIHPAAKQINIGDDVIDYTKLVICTGSKHFKPPINGLESAGVHYLRTATDAETIRNASASSSSAVVIGAGFIGLEVASSLRKKGLEVTVLELADRVLSRVSPIEISSFFERLHQSNGVSLELGIKVSEISSSGDAYVVKTSTGQEFNADLVIMGTGASANSDLAESAGLDVDNGILVNEFNQTSDSDIYAIGDCANQYNPVCEQRLRLESIQNTMDQAKTAASSLCGQPVANSALPWFWSDQYDVKHQFAGLFEGADESVLRGTAEPGQSFSIWHFKNDKLIAVDAINDPRAFMTAQRLIPSRPELDKESIANPEFELKELL